MTSSRFDTDREALIAEARRWPRGDDPTPSAAPGDLIQRLADALEELAERVRAEQREADAQVAESEIVRSSYSARADVAAAIREAGQQ